MYYFSVIQGKETRHELCELYAACKQIANQPDAVVICAKQKKPKSRLVAFWCGWEHKVKPGFGATRIEREAITDYRL